MIGTKLIKRRSLGMILTLTMVFSIIVLQSKEVSATQIEKEYIIEVSDNKLYDEICEEYSDSIVEASDTSDILDNENVVVLNLNKEKVKEI